MSEALGLHATWLRAPSDTIDTITDQYIGPKTLVRTMISGAATVTNDSSDGYPSLWQGIIAWHGSTDAVIPNDLPDPQDGSHDWITWMPAHTNGLTTVTSHTEFHWGFGGGYWESQAMRKLPPGVGILWVARFTENTPTGHLTARINMSARFALKGDVTATGLGGG